MNRGDSCSQDSMRMLDVKEVHEDSQFELCLIIVYTALRGFTFFTYSD